MPPKAGRVIARRYHLEESIGQGAMGIVWRAHDRRLHRKVAIKEVLLNAAIDEDGLANRYERTQREAQTAARLSHPNIVRVYDVIMHQGRPWIVMELIPSSSLGDLLGTAGPVSALRAARIGCQLLAALTAAHAAGVLHRDMKPANVLIAPDRTADGWGERAVLTDFGIAQFEDDPRMTETGQWVGTVGFTAPERINGSDATPASDLWSLGATIYAAVVGNGPFDRDTTLGTMSAIMSDSLPPAPPAGRLTPLIAGLLRHDPADRLTATAAARKFAEILPLMAAETGAGRHEDTQPSAQPAQLVPAEPLGAPTQTFPPHPRLEALPMASPASAESGEAMLHQLSRENGRDTPRPARRTRNRNAARRLRPPARITTACVAAIAISITVILVALHRPSPSGRPSASISKSTSSTPPSTESSSAVPVPVAGTPPEVVGAINDHITALPAGFHMWKVPPSAAGKTGGFSIDAPNGWLPMVMGQGAYQYSADGVTFLEIDLAQHNMTNMVSWAADLHMQDRGEYPGYQRAYSPPGKPLKQYIQPETILGTNGALWQFDYLKGEKKLKMRVNILLFTVEQQSYTITMTAPAGTDDDNWNTRNVLGRMAEMLHTFEPLPD